MNTNPTLRTEISQMTTEQLEAVIRDGNPSGDIIAETAIAYAVSEMFRRDPRNAATTVYHIQNEAAAARAVH